MTPKLPFDPAESIQATRLAWAIDCYAAGELTSGQIEATHEFDPGYDVAAHLRRFRMFRRPIDEVISYEPHPVRPRAVVRSGKDTAMVRVVLGDAPEHRILAMALMKCPAPGVTTRLATESDARELRDLERRCPVETGGVSVYYDRGDDYFAQQRLMPHHVSSVAEYEGRIVGVSSDATHRIRVAGREYRATYRFHLRVDPIARGLGVLPALNASQGTFILGERPLAIPSVFVAEQNEQMLATRGPDQSDQDWETRVERIIIPCRARSGPAFGRLARPEDAPRIALLLAGSHGSEELALDFDEAWVDERLSRSPRDYSWSNVMISENAVLGVWDSRLRIVRAGASGTTETRTATALDWGFTSGAEAEMEALLRAACSSLTERGVDDLVIFSSPPSLGRDLLVRLARTVERFRVATGGAQPSSDSTNGIYVDPVYF
ncbi:MAG: hypothetical protein ABI559_09660 [Chloroflexota bacterium]